jgi:peptidoglycan/xylan/chitin deacetylase (PgdA/CDA1 family)
LVDRRVQRHRSVEAGQDVVIPLRARNPLGVYANGFQHTDPLLSPIRSQSQRDDHCARCVRGANGVSGAERLSSHHDEAARAFLEGKEPLPKKTVVITIDDGYRATYQVAFPILKKYGFPATVYLYSDFVGAADAMTWAQMQEMVRSGLIEIQPHSKTHPNLTVRLAGETDARYQERVRREVEAPIAAIQDRLSAPSFSYAYPLWRRQ